MKKIIILLLTPFLLGILACNFPWNNNDTAEEAVSLQLTLSAMETEAVPVLEQEATETEEESLPQADPTATAEPTQTNVPITPNFSFEGVSFRYGADIAANAWGEIVPEYIPEEEGIERAEPEHILVHFNDFIAPLYYHDAKIIVYPVDRLLELDEYTEWHVTTLQSLVTEQPAQPADFPFLPMWNAAALFRSNVAYVNFQNGSGIRYLTQYGQALWPINNTGIFYTFQGLTTDGRFYISAILPVNHPNLLNTGDEVGNDWAPYYDETAWDLYIDEQVEMLNSQPPQSFTPSLLALDEMFQTLLVDR